MGFILFFLSNTGFQLYSSFPAAVGAGCGCWCNQFCFSGEQEHPSRRGGRSEVGQDQQLLSVGVPVGLTSLAEVK